MVIRTLVGSPTVIPSTKHEMHSPSNFHIVPFLFVFGLDLIEKLLIKVLKL